MALKTLRCCGDASSPEQRSTLMAMHTLKPPQNCIRLLGGLSPIHSMRQRRDQSLMWGIKGPFLLAVAIVVTLVVRGCSVAGAQTTLVQCNPGILGITRKLSLQARQFSHCTDAMT
jgi:hypothetical protein